VFAAALGVLRRATANTMYFLWPTTFLSYLLLPYSCLFIPYSRLPTLY
jgi:hypothetical protein